jgi:hypothetical protein
MLPEDLYAAVIRGIRALQAARKVKVKNRD